MERWPALTKQAMRTDTSVSEAWPAPAEKIPADELRAFHRFCECCEDGEGYDVDATMMRALWKKGLLRHLGFGRYETSTYGNHIRQTTTLLR
jgi:hypothetical protein